MPIQQITVVPSRETAGNSKSAPSSKDNSEGRKTAGRSGSRSSNISKASNSTAGQTTASRTSITPSSQDICSSGQLGRVAEDACESQKPGRRISTSGMTASGSAATAAAAAAAGTLGSSQQKKQVKRRHRRKRSVCGALECVESNNGKREQAERSERSHSSDRSEPGERRERSSRSKRELPPRLRCSAAPPSDSSSEGEAWREARSWSKEKARRGRRRSASSREGTAAGGQGKVVEDKTEVMELQSVGSDEGAKENQPLVRDAGGLKKRHSRASVKKEEHGGAAGGGACSRSQGSPDLDPEKNQRSASPDGSSSLAEDAEELITKKYQEKGSGGGDMSVPTPQKHCGLNGGVQPPPMYSDDSELEVCRICHCEGDSECPLIMPCRCTGSLSFVHQSCLNQWIKSSDTRCCELCKFDFVMETKLKPLRKWEKLNMSKSERRKIFCSVMFHVIAIVCMLWSVYVLVRRTAEEIRLGKNEELWRFTLLKYYEADGVLEWPFWTKLIVVAIGFTGGLIFMYIQCKVYLQLWRRLKAFNRVITVQNCPEKGLHSVQAGTGNLTNGRPEAVEAPAPTPTQAPTPAQEAQIDSDMSVEAAVAPAQNPV